MHAEALSALDLFAWPLAEAGRHVRAARVARMTADAALSPERLGELVRRIAAGRDRAAFAELFGHFAPRLKSYMLRLGAGPVEADDLAQEAMLAIWRKAASYDPARAGAATWVFTIARNLRIDALRRERCVEPLDIAAASEVAAGDAGADAVIAAAQSEQDLRAALAGLSDEETALVRMSFFEDKPHSAISRTLGMPLGTVKSKLRRVLARLRVSLEAAR